MEQSIKLELTVNEVNGILQIIAQAPYAQVAQLFQKIQMQAAVQLPPPTEQQPQ